MVGVGLFGCVGLVVSLWVGDWLFIVYFVVWFVWCLIVCCVCWSMARCLGFLCLVSAGGCGFGWCVVCILLLIFLFW